MPLRPFSRVGSNDSRPESTRATVRSSLPIGDGTGESSTPTLSCAVRLDRTRASFEGGWTW
jgi:hypothetical protein